MAVTRTKRTDLSPLTQEDVERLERLAGAPVAADDPDNPVQSPGELATARRRGRPPKELISLRVDPDVVEWFRRPGRGYQTRMNAALRAFMERERDRG